MKKLMFAVAAVAAMVAVAEEVAPAVAQVKSQTVGFSAINDEGNNNPGVGGLFCPIGLGETYKLTDIKVIGEDGDFMVPGAEYIQKLNPNGSAVIARYTYVSAEALEDEFEDEWEDYKEGIGWWKYEKGMKIMSLIEDGDFSNKLSPSDPEADIVVGTAFLGYLKGNGLRFESAGEVPSVSTAFNDAGNNNPFFLNYLPATIDLTQVTVSAEEDFMVPGAEYLQVLNPNGSAVIGRYTYVSQAALEDEFEDEWEDYADGIGWWNYEKGMKIMSLIEDGDFSKKVTSKELVPGFTFLGYLKGNGLDFNFPSPIPAK